MLDGQPILRTRVPSHANAEPVKSECTAPVASGGGTFNTSRRNEKIHKDESGYIKRIKGGSVSHIGKNTLQTVIHHITYHFFTQLNGYHACFTRYCRAKHEGLLKLPAVPGDRTS